MPVTAKLSRKFYETFGDEIANDLVEWFNAVDATYKTDLEVVNERNFQRFDDRLERRLADLRGELLQRVAELRQENGVLRLDVHEQIGRVRSEIEQAKTSTLRWMFAFWLGTLVPLAGLVIYLTGR